MGSLLLVGLVAVMGALAWAVRWVWRFLAIGASYKSKILCITIFGSRRDVDPNNADEILADSYWFLQLFRARVDREQQSVTASFLGLRPQTAIPRFSPIGTASIPWSEGKGSASLQKVIEHAFKEVDNRRLRRTRAIVVVQDGRIIGERYAPGFTADTPLPGWSMTKSVMGTLIGILVGEGKLSLNDTELLPEWKRPDPRAEIRLKDLLRMRSGLRFVENYSNPGSDVVRMLFEQRDAAKFAASLPPKHKPGTFWSYASGTTNILSRIARNCVSSRGADLHGARDSMSSRGADLHGALDSMSSRGADLYGPPDEDYLQWPRRVLFDPIGAASARMGCDESGTFVGSSFMIATARDWARIGQLYLQDGTWEGERVVSPSWIRFCTTPLPQSEGQMYGAHWWLKLLPELGGGTPEAARIPDDAFFALGHEGQTLTIIPSRGLVIVRLGLSIYIDAWNHAEFVASVLDAT